MVKLIGKLEQRQLQTKFFLVLILSLVMTIIILSSILYINFEKIALNEVETYIKDSLSKVSYSANFMIDTAKMISIQIYNDRDIMNLLNYNEVDELEKSLCNSRLSSFKNATPYIESIYVYNGLSNRIYSNPSNKLEHNIDDFYDKDILSLINDQIKSKHLLPIPRIMKGYATSSSSDVYTYAFYENPNIRNKSGDNIIILNISVDWMRNIINSMDFNREGTTFIINNKGQMVINDNKNAILTDLSKENYIKKILGSNRTYDYFADTINGEKYLITYVMSDVDNLGWRFISIIPYKKITGQINNMKRITILICSFLIILGLLISTLSSRMLYKPINKILANLKLLESENRKSMNSLKQEFLRNLVRFGSQYKMELLSNRFKEFNINLVPTDNLALIIFKIDNYNDFCMKNNSNERHLFIFAIMKIITEISSTIFKNECIDMECDHIVLLINIPGVTDNTQTNMISNVAEKIRNSVCSNLEISLSCIIGPVSENTISNIGNLYNEALDASAYRLFYGPGCIINSDIIRSTKSDDYSYPKNKEKALISYLMQRKFNEVIVKFNEIVDTTKDYSYAVFNLVILRITLAVTNTIENMEINNGLALDYDFNEFISKISTLETLEDINERFYEMFRSIIYRMGGKKHSNHDELVNSMIQSINKQFADKNLSIEVFANYFNMSPIYLGRIFKEITSKSVAEFITEVRIQKAKEMLSNSYCTVNEIAEAIGLSNANYFYTIFKKQNGITPAEYRQINSLVK